MFTFFFKKSLNFPMDSLIAFLTISTKILAESPKIFRSKSEFFQKNSSKRFSEQIECIFVNHA